MRRFRIGTRQSPLALWQTQHILEHLQNIQSDILAEVVHFTTQGDRMLDKALPEIGGKGVFTQDLEQALLRGEIDLAVHSLKDLPTQMDAHFMIGAIPERASPFDALVSRNGEGVDTLPDGAIIGTSSLRRAAQLKAYRPDLQTRPIRGNVETRLRKVQAPEEGYDATILAVAGLTRLGQQRAITEILHADLMLPAPGQGAIAVQCRSDDTATLETLARIDHAPTRLCVSAERAFLQQLQAGCSLPVSAFARIDGEQIFLTGRVNSRDGQKTITVRGHAPLDENISLGIQLAKEAFAQGAAELLQEKSL